MSDKLKNFLADAAELTEQGKYDGFSVGTGVSPAIQPLPATKANPKPRNALGCERGGALDDPMRGLR